MSREVDALAVVLETLDARPDAILDPVVDRGVSSLRLTRLAHARGRVLELKTALGLLGRIGAPGSTVMHVRGALREAQEGSASMSIDDALSDMAKLRNEGAMNG